MAKTGAKMIKGCAKIVNVNSYSTFECGTDALGGKPWLCDDCMEEQDESNK